MITDNGSRPVDRLIRPMDTLVHGELVSADGRGLAGAAGADRRAGVRCGRPLIYPVPAGELPTPLRRRAEVTGRRYFGVLFAFDLDELPGNRRYTTVRFDVSLADDRVIAVQLHRDGDALGLAPVTDAPDPFRRRADGEPGRPSAVDAPGPFPHRGDGEPGPSPEDGRLAPASATALRALTAAGARPGWLHRLITRRGRPRAWVSGAQSHRFGWTYEDPRGDLLLPRTYGMHALLETPGGMGELAGALGVHVEVGGARWESARRQHAALREVATFTEELPTYAAAGPAAVRLCMAADISRYSSRTSPGTELLQRHLVEVLARARGAAGIDESAVAPQPQGDGQFTVLPIGIDESVVIPRLVRGLDTALHQTNRTRDPADRMRLRLALHRGLMKPGASGWVGSAAIAVHRILDSPPVRAALADEPAADFVLGIPDVLFHDVVAHTAEPPLPEEFSPVSIELPAKDFVESGWLYLGGLR